MSHPVRRITLAVLGFGAIGIASQIILTRELLVIFYGNEISIGFILGVWLFMGALGSSALGRYSDSIARKFPVFMTGIFSLNLLVFISVCLVRCVKPFFNMHPGEIMPVSIMALTTLITLAPACVLLGFLFTLGCRILSEQKQREAAQQVGYVYALEAAGAAAGGLVCNFFLIKLLPSIYVALCMFAFSLCITLPMLRWTGMSSLRRNFFKTTIMILLIMVIFFYASGALGRLDAWTKGVQWRGFNLIDNKDSLYGNISVTAQEDLYSFFNNGVLMFTVPDALAQEEAVHFAMLQRPEAMKVLLIGGGASGVSYEVLKYPVRRVDYVELDPALIGIARKHLSETEYFMLDDPRLRTINADGRFFVKNTQEKYDVILLNLPDPLTAQLNRFYTLEFFRMIRKRMSDDRAVFCLGLGSSENYISRELEVFLGSIYGTLKEVFGDVKIVPGDTAYFLASPAPDAVTLRHDELTDRLRRAGVNTQFVREYYLSSKLSPDRVSHVAGRLENVSSPAINTDFSPVSYYHGMVLWTTYFKNGVKPFLRYVNRKVVYLIMALMYMAVLLWGLAAKRASRAKRSVLMAIATTGFSEISFQVIIIIGFQILYGYLYYKLGLIITSFMVGLGLGGFLISRRINAISRPYQDFIKIQLAVCLYPLLLPMVFYFLQFYGNTLNAGANIIFALLPVVAGVIGGLQFPLANKICIEEKRYVGRVSGLSYGADMTGSCLGAILVSAFIIPVIGIYAACISIALLNTCSLAMLIVNRNNA